MENPIPERQEAAGQSLPAGREVSKGEIILTPEYAFLASALLRRRHRAELEEMTGTAVFQAMFAISQTITREVVQGITPAEPPRVLESTAVLVDYLDQNIRRQLEEITQAHGAGDVQAAYIAQATIIWMFEGHPDMADRAVIDESLEVARNTIAALFAEERDTNKGSLDEERAGPDHIPDEFRAAQRTELEEIAGTSEFEAKFAAARLAPKQALQDVPETDAPRVFTSVAELLTYLDEDVRPRLAQFARRLAEREAVPEGPTAETIPAFTQALIRRVLTEHSDPSDRWSLEALFAREMQAWRRAEIDALLRKRGEGGAASPS